LPKEGGVIERGKRKPRRKGLYFGRKKAFVSLQEKGGGGGFLASFPHARRKRRAPFAVTGEGISVARADNRGLNYSRSHPKAVLHFEDLNNGAQAGPKLGMGGRESSEAERGTVILRRGEEKKKLGGKGGGKGRGEKKGRTH